MHLISFDASPGQLSKLRNGHNVRIKKGTGFNLIVNPSNYSLITKSFGKNKGVQLKLSSEELDANKSLTPEQHAQLGEANGMSGGNIFHKIKKAFNSRTAKRIGRELKPLTRALKSTAKEILHEKIADAHMNSADNISNPRMAHLSNIAANLAHEKVHGMGLGAGMNVHHALKLANLASANANHELAKMHNISVHGQQSQPLVRGYYDDVDAPPSRGTGLNNHHNLIRGRGSLIAQDHFLPPALQSQPYGANFHMQFKLPPQYKKFHDGGDMEGRGLYL